MTEQPYPAIPNEAIVSKIYLIRGQKILLDADLAALYRVETKHLKRQVKRNIERFPEDFMFELTPEEVENLRCQFGTSSWGGTRYAPMAFTEQGVSMLSSVLSSPIAIQVNIRIIRIFHKMREFLLTHQDLLIKVDELERKVGTQDEQIQLIFEYLREFMQKPDQERSLIGYRN